MGQDGFRARRGRLNEEDFMPRKWRHGDAENTAFDLPAAIFDDHKPGLEIGREKKSGQADRGEDGDRRFARSDRKDIPKGSLAERVRKAAAKT